MKTLFELDEIAGPSQAQPAYIANSPALMALKSSAMNLAASGGTVLITGDAGVGKKALAEFIHYCSPCRVKPLIPVSCRLSSMADFGRELFGHEAPGRSSRSLGCIRAASGGTLLLDRLDELSPLFQGRILDAFKKKAVLAIGGSVAHSVDLRIIATSIQSLATLRRFGRLSEEFLKRLAPVELSIPPLRQRPDDITPLAEHFLGVYAELFGERLKTLSSAAAQALSVYPWPGNARELSEMMQNAHSIAEGDCIEMQNLPTPQNWAWARGTQGWGVTNLLTSQPRASAVATIPN